VAKKGCDPNNVNDGRHNWQQRGAPVRKNRTQAVVQKVCAGCGTSKSVIQSR